MPKNEHTLGTIRLQYYTPSNKKWNEIEHCFLKKPLERKWNLWLWGNYSCGKSTLTKLIQNWYSGYFLYDPENWTDWRNNYYGLIILNDYCGNMTIAKFNQLCDDLPIKKFNVKCGQIKIEGHMPVVTNGQYNIRDTYRNKFSKEAQRIIALEDRFHIVEMETIPSDPINPAKRDSRYLPKVFFQYEAGVWRQPSYSEGGIIYEALPYKPLYELNAITFTNTSLIITSPTNHGKK